MTLTINMGKVKLVGSGYCEMPRDGRRFRFHVNRYRHDDGTEWGEILSMTEVPHTGQPYLYIPTFGAENGDEVDFLRQEFEYEQANPTAEQADWNGRRQQTRLRKMQGYNDYREQRADIIRRSPRTLKGGRP